MWTEKLKQRTVSFSRYLQGTYMQHTSQKSDEAMKLAMMQEAMKRRSLFFSICRCKVWFLVILGKEFNNEFREVRRHQPRGFYRDTGLTKLKVDSTL